MCERPLFTAPFAVGVLVTLLSLRLQAARSDQTQGPDNPLQLKNAVQMTVIFQVVLFAVHYLRAMQERPGCS